jgi:hypothetical protein
MSGRDRDADTSRKGRPPIGKKAMTDASDNVVGVKSVPKNNPVQMRFTACE